MTTDSDNKCSSNGTRLEVLIATMGDDGIRRVADMTLPRVDGVRYLVSWQCPSGDIPESLSRPDVTVVPTDSRGLSNNRNDAFNAATAPLLLIADDDLDYTPEGLRTVIDTLESHPDVDIATFRHTGGDGKQFPDFEFDLRQRVRNYYATSFEIALRLHVVRGDRAVRFDPRFGIGAPRFTAAEELFFIDDALRAGFTGRFFPVTIVSHDGVTTAYRRLTPGVLRSQGVWIRHRHPFYSAWSRIPLIAWRHYRAGRYPLMPAIIHIFTGWTYRRRPAVAKQ